MSLDRAKRAIDRYQQRHRWVAFPVAVQRKYAEDDGKVLAVTIGYYGFFSLFPLLLVLATLLGYALGAHPALRGRILGSALGQFPVVGQELRASSLHGSLLALAIGGGAALWAGSGVFLAVADAMDRIWGVPRARRANMLHERLRALLLSAAFGVGVLATAAVSSVSGSAQSFVWRFGLAALSLPLYFTLFVAAFLVLTSQRLRWSELWRGALVGSVAYAVLQLVGTLYISHVLRSASAVYGTFALVIGLLTWIHLLAHVTLLAAEVNVVAARGLWPQALFPSTQAPETPRARAGLTRSTG